MRDYEVLLQIKPRNVSNWIDYSSQFDGATLDKKFDIASSINMKLNDPNKLLTNSIYCGCNIRLKAGLGGLPDDWLFWGYVSQDGINNTEDGVSVKGLDFIGDLVGDTVNLTEPDKPYYDFYGNMVHSKNYDGRECFEAIQDLLSGTNFTIAGSGTYPTCHIRPEDKIYCKNENKKSIIDKILKLCKDEDLSTYRLPLYYHYYQINTDTANLFKFIKEKDIPSSIAIHNFTDENGIVSVKPTSQVEQYTRAVINDTVIDYNDTDAVAKYGVKTIKLDKKYDSQESNYQYAKDIVNKFKFIRYSYQVIVWNGLNIELGDIVNINSERYPEANGKHQVYSVNYQFDKDSVTTTMTLDNPFSKFLDYL